MRHEPPLRDLRFILHETLRIDARPEIAGYADLTPDVTDAIFAEAGKLATEVLAPLNPVGDAGCTLENGVVRTPPGFRAAMDALRAGGWTGLECAEEWGGQGLPNVVGLAVGLIHSAANMALMICSGLTHGAYSVLEAHGSPDQKATYLPKLASGEWLGTMNLTEPQCGTDLGLVSTKAVPGPDGGWRLTGDKIWISGGDHDLAENVVHLVLARIPDAPKGTKGLSLFVCPKVLPEGGGLGARNGVTCVRVEKKMGLGGSATCALRYEDAVAWMVGEPNRGLPTMFTMMNEARILVAMQGLGQAQAAYHLGLDWARERLQGRAPTGPAFPDRPADPLIVHPDVRRMLMDAKAWVEGARCFMLYGSSLIDAEKRHDDPAERGKAADLIALLIPVLKGVLTDGGFHYAVEMQQIFGGAGYMQGSGIEQVVRDARIAMVYEGANGVQALDLVGRKLAMKGGAAVMAYFGVLRAFLKAHEEDAALKRDFLDPLKGAMRDMQSALEFFMAEGVKDPNAALSGATDFMHLMGHVAIGHAWAMMAAAATRGLDANPADRAFYAAKLATGRHYMARLLPETGLRLARIRTGAATVMALPAEAF